MPENEKQPDYDGLKETISAIKEARKNARENPADEQEVRDFRKDSSYPPKPVRKENKIPSEGKLAAAERARTGKTEESYRLMQSTKRLNTYKTAFLEGYKNLAALGLEETVIERLFGLGSEYIAKNVGTDEEFQKSYQEAMDKLQTFLSNQMLIKALGYNYKERKTIYCKKDIMKQKAEDNGSRPHTAHYNRQRIRGNKWIKYRKEVSRKHQPGDAQMFIFFMTNRFPDKWKVSRELLTGKAEGYDSKPSQRIRKAIESLGRDVLEQDTDRPETEPIVSGGLAQLPVGSDKDDKK